MLASDDEYARPAAHQDRDPALFGGGRGRCHPHHPDRGASGRRRSIPSGTRLYTGGILLGALSLVLYQNIWRVSFDPQRLEYPVFGGTFLHRALSLHHRTDQKVLKTVVSLAIIAAALAALRSKVGGLKTINLDTGLGEQKGVMAKGKYIIAKAGQYVIDGFNYIKGKIPFLSKNNDTAAKVEKAAEAVTETSTNA